MQEPRDKQGRFVKGTSGNPQGGGRPSIAKSLSEAIRARGLEVFDKNTGELRNDRFATALWDLALTHTDPHVQLKAMSEILNRTEGRPPVKVDITTDGSSLIKGYPVELLEPLT